ncbi:hypothetical protein [Tautonia sociabilis]|uniref:Uncharacterized protein n=1 Tax=Tautonia sociabilis TaxID=2080755 RepID=A0A432MLR5_9BACT|nr:hypothetical protein [Tautonia sociabilis]RUL88038.1 hypothetical protein TsocGM_08830 [Tautonia sociabilis]
MAFVEDVSCEDFPWAAGRLTAFSATSELREALEWLARMAEADELEDPPFDVTLLEGWRLRSADGREREVSPPLIDFEANTAMWR